MWSKLCQVTIGSLNSHYMVSFMITTGSLNSQDMIFQVTVYVIENVWMFMLYDVYVWRSIFNRGLYGFVK